MTNYLFAFFFLISTAALCQSAASTSIPNPAQSATDSVRIVVEQMPEFPGGIPGLSQFLGQTLRYPKQARKARITGKVFANFVVGEDGIIRNIEISQGIGYGCDEEVMRVIGLMPKWKPGIQDGKAVAVRYRLPIYFGLK